jgi:hypothetical protein
MLRISIIDTPKQRRLIVEGKLIGPWATEFKSTCDDAKADLGERELVIELKHVTTISEEGERVLLDLMGNGIKFCSRGVFTRQILKLLSRRAIATAQGTKR